MQYICDINKILPGTGVCALLDDQQVALFRPFDDEQIFGLSNIDPFYQASVLSRGIICEFQQQLWVASPLKKQHFRLHDGYCLEDPSHSVKSFVTEVRGSEVWVGQSKTD